MQRIPQEWSQGVSAARAVLDRLGWGYDASAFWASATPEMRGEAERTSLLEGEAEGFFWYLGRVK